MSIQRFESGPRMSQVVVHGNTVYLAGVVANNAAGESVTKQTQDILATIDGHLAKAGTGQEVDAAVGHDLHHRHEDVPGNERRVGRLGVARQHPRPRHGRSEAGSAAIHRRDHGDGGEVIFANDWRAPITYQVIDRRAQNLRWRVSAPR